MMRRLGLWLGLSMASALCTELAWAAPSDMAPSSWCVVSSEQAAQPAGVKLLARAAQALAAAPHALPRLHTEGTLPHQGIFDESVAAKRDFPLMRDAALAWRLSGDPRYAEQVELFLRAWVTTYVPSFNPIDETGFDALIDAYALARDGLSDATRSATERFLRGLAQGYLARTATRSDPSKSPKSPTWTNNWQSHRIKLMAMSAAALEDRELLNLTHRAFLQQLADNIRPDGSVADFEDRDALHYVVYDLEPLVMAAVAAHPFDKGWLQEKTNAGISLAAAIDWLVPYAKGERTHQEFVHSHVAFDKARADAGMAGYAGEWDRKTAKQLFWWATQLDPTYQALAQGLGPLTPDWLALCTAR